MWVRFLLTSIALSFFAYGQVKKDENRYLRIIPLANKAEFREGPLKNGIRTMLPPRPGEVPPFQIRVKDEVPQKAGLTLRLDRISRFVAIGPKIQQIEISEAQKAGGKAWYTFKAPQAQRTLAVLYRDHKKLDWFNPKSLILKDDAKIFPVGSARFVNVSDRTLAMIFKLVKNGKSVEEIKGLAPGKTYTRPLSAAGEMAKIVIYEKGKQPDEMEEIFLNQIRTEEKERLNLFFYKNSAKAGVRRVILPEKIPALPKL